MGVSLKQIDTVLSLTAEGSTIPFIARYRKDLTGNLDEVAIKAIIDRDKSLTALAERKETVLAKIEEQGKLTEALKQAIEAAEKLADVEELYLPYKENGGPRRRLPEKQDFFLWHVSFANSPDLEAEAQKFTCEAFPTETAALAGAVDILVEAISEDTQLRALTYQEIHGHSLMTSTLKDESLDPKRTFEIYYDFSEKIKNMQGYRTLALNRGEKLGVLKVGFEHQLDRIIRILRLVLKLKCLCR